MPFISSLATLLFAATNACDEPPSKSVPPIPAARATLAVVYSDGRLKDRDTRQPVVADDPNAEWSVSIDPSVPPQHFVDSLFSLVEQRKAELLVKLLVEGVGSASFIVAREKDVTLSELPDSKITVPRGNLASARLGPADTLVLTVSTRPPAASTAPRAALLALPKGTPWKHLLAGLNQLERQDYRRVAFEFEE